MIIAVLGVVFCFVSAIFGNPISAWIASNKISDYVTVKYPTLDLELSNVQYSLSNGSYGCTAQSRTSKDTVFVIQYSRGKVTDDYQYEVANHFTTYRRLSKDFDALVTNIIEKGFSHKTTMILGDLVGETTPLTPDAPLDLNNMPLQLSLTVSILSDDRTDEQMAKLLLELDQLMRNENIPIAQYTLRLEEPLPEQSKPGSGENVYLEEFPATSITKDIEALASAIKAHRLEMEQKDKQ